MYKGIRTILFSSIVIVMLTGCSDQAPEAMSGQESMPPVQAVEYVARGDLSIVTGQKLYVPAYSEIYSANGDLTWGMTVTLSIRNTNVDKSIFIGSVKYFDTNGQLVTEYVESPLRLAPMATTEYVIASDDDRGGTGANFIVGWGAEEQVYEPVVEAVMISTIGTKGFSLLSPARVLEEKR